MRNIGLAAAWIGLAVVGCGPVQSTSAIVDAEAELAAAHQANAQNRAPFEMTTAQAYLTRAKERVSRSDYQVAVAWARRAAACAEVARQRSEVEDPDTVPSPRCPLQAASVDTSTVAPGPGPGPGPASRPASHVRTSTGGASR